MTVSLASIIADLESKIANADSSSSLSDLLSLLNSAERLTGTKSIYDSSELLTTAAEEGSVKFQSDGSLRFYNGTNWDLLNDPTYTPNHTMGDTYGYTTGGQGPLPADPTNPSYFTVRNIIDHFPFASDTNATDTGDLTATRHSAQSSSSQTHGYTAGSYGPNSNVIDKFAMGTTANATDVGDLEHQIGTGVGHSSTTHGYVAGGITYSPPAGYVADIEKYSHSSDGNSVDGGADLIYRLSYGTANGANSPTHGYTTGSAVPGPSSAALYLMQKYPFVSDDNATKVGDIGFNLQRAAAANNDTHGYALGGVAPGAPAPTGPAGAKLIQKFSFSTDENATVLTGLLTGVGWGRVGLSSKTNGYTSGGSLGTGPTTVDTIDKFPFASDANATDVGDLTRKALNTGGNII